MAVHLPQLTDFKPVLRQHCLTVFKTETYTGLMMNRRLPAAVLVLALLGAAPWLHAQAARRALYVSALDKTGAPVSDLAPADIAVREDNVAREVLTVAPAVEPMQIAVLVDNSQAAAPFIRDYREALAAFVDALTNGERPGTRNEVAIITVAERPTIATDYTTDRGALVKSAQRIFSNTDSGAYLLDAIIETSQGMTKRRSPRPVIAAIATEEGPELSDRFYQQVLTTLRASGAALHVIVVGRRTNDSHDRSFVISEGPRSTGGQSDSLLTSTALTGRLKRLAAELTHQFRVTYSRPQSLIPPERITVSAARPGLTVRGTPVVADREQERP